MTLQSTEGRISKRKPEIERFERWYIPEPNIGCWLWLGSINSKGYGQFQSSFGRAAHRFSYAFYKGEIPKGYDVHHNCRQRSCCNPDHLEAITHLENISRRVFGATIEARRRRMTTEVLSCPHGHALTPENIYVRKGKYVECRICRERSRIENRDRTLAPGHVDIIIGQKPARLTLNKS